ncbi:MAG: hypothetical protein GXO79_16245, partial [Chlorobi bacterium]|nr:hypothetical protein [Chlorobiota bacterium]
MNNKKSFLHSIFILLMLFIMPSCQYETIELNKCTDVSFTNDIQPIFDNKCNSCHSANIAMAGL